MRQYAFLLLVLLSACIDHNTFNSQIQFKSDTTSIRHFLLDNNLTATKTTEGIWYFVDSLGLGIYPVLSDSIQFSYTAFRIPSMVGNDTALIQVDEAVAQKTLLSSAIAGWQYGIPYFPTKSKGRLYIPSGFAFGQNHYNAIPSNSNLLYKVQVLATKGTHFTLDTTALNTYINSITDSLLLNKITVIKDLTGVRYAYDTLYDNVNPPGLSDLIDVTYTGKVLGADSLFVNVTDTTTLALNDQLAAWKIVLPKITPGTHVTLFVPSGYGYGSVFPTKSIPANSNLVYQINLIKVH